jgi:DNA-binding transcriptional LysR family regulator
LNIRFIETFVTLARLGSVRRVAEHLHATPGAISMRLSSLESDLGVTLFNYDHKTLTLTPDGTRLLRHAEALLEANRAMRQAARGSGDVEGRIRIGVIESVVHTWLPDMMKAMHTSLPSVEPDLAVDLTVHLTDEMLRGGLDLLLRVSSGERSNFAETVELMELPVHWIARRGLVPQRDMLRKVLKRQLLAQMRGSVPYLAAEKLAHELAVKNGMAASDLRLSGSPSIAAMVSLVREGIGVAIIPGLFVKEYIERGDLVVLPLPPPPPFSVAMWYKADAPPIVQRTADVVRGVCKTYCKRHDNEWVKHLG